MIKPIETTNLQKIPIDELSGFGNNLLNVNALLVYSVSEFITYKVEMFGTFPNSGLRPCNIFRDSCVAKLNIMTALMYLFINSLINMA